MGSIEIVREQHELAAYACYTSSSEAHNLAQELDSQEAAALPLQMHDKYF
jgi:hypothetical protein